jgi:hypothetical protein
LLCQRRKRESSRRAMETFDEEEETDYHPFSWFRCIGGLSSPSLNPLSPV